MEGDPVEQRHESETETESEDETESDEDDEPVQYAPQPQPSFCNDPSCCCPCQYSANYAMRAILPAMMKDAGYLAVVTILAYVLRPQQYFWGFVEYALGLVGDETSNLQKYLASAMTFGAGLYVAASVFRSHSSERKPPWVTNVLKMAIVCLFLISFSYFYGTGILDKFIMSFLDCELSEKSRDSQRQVTGTCPATTFP